MRSLIAQTTPLDAEDEQIKMDANEMAQRYFEKCLQVSKQQGFTAKVAECHQRLGQIHEINGNLEEAIKERKQFLEITKDT